MHYADWFLTADERGNPACAAARLVHRQRRDAARRTAAPTSPGSSSEVGALAAGDHLFFTDWRGDADERLRPEGPTVGELFGDAARARRRRQGADVALALATSCPTARRRTASSATTVNEAGGEVLLDQRVRRGGSHHQKLVVIRHRDDPDRDVAFVGGIDLCHSRRDDADHHGDPQAVADGRGVRRRTRRGTTSSCEVRGPAVGALDTVFRERWDDPHSARHATTRSPGSRDRLRRRRPEPPTRCPRSRRPAGRRAARRAGAAHLSGDPARATPSRRTASAAVARGYTKALRRARRLVYLEDQYLWSPHVARRCSPTRCAQQPGPAPGRRGAAAPRRGRPVRAAAQPGRAACRRCRSCRDGGARTGCTCSTWRTTRAHRSTCTRRSASSTTCGPCVGQRQPQPPVLDATTASCRAPCSTTARDAREPADPAGPATAPGASPATCGWRWCASTSTAGRGDDADLARPRTTRVAADGGRGATPSTRGTRGGRRGPRPPGRLRPHRPGTDAAVCTRRLGDAGLPARLRPGRAARAPTGPDDGTRPVDR